MANVYSSLYRLNPIGRTVPIYEPISAVIGNAGINYFAYFEVTIPVGTTTADKIWLAPFQMFFPTTTPQIAGVRAKRVVLSCAGDVGGSVTVNAGFSTTSPTAFGAALTTLQSATTLDVPIATIIAAAPVLTNDDLALIVAAGTSVTSRLVKGWIDYGVQAP
jgi:hypothetical protein